MVNVAGDMRVGDSGRDLRHFSFRCGANGDPFVFFVSVCSHKILLPRGLLCEIVLGTYSGGMLLCNDLYSLSYLRFFFFRNRTNILKYC